MKKQRMLFPSEKVRASEYPILLSGKMVRALLREVDPKTQTRRIITPIPPDIPSRHRDSHDLVFEYGCLVEYERIAGLWNERRRWHCPYGTVKDLLWVRESFQLYDEDGDFSLKEKGKQEIHYIADNTNPHTTGVIDGGGWSRVYPSIHMPRWASRIDLAISSIRAERLQDITEKDAKAEGIAVATNNSGLMHRLGFVELWDSINGKRGFGWKVNPWVWRVEFKRYYREATA